MYDQKILNQRAFHSPYQLNEFLKHIGIPYDQRYLIIQQWFIDREIEITAHKSQMIELQKEEKSYKKRWTAIHYMAIGSGILQWLIGLYLMIPLAQQQIWHWLLSIIFIMFGSITLYQSMFIPTYKKLFRFIYRNYRRKKHVMVREVPSKRNNLL